MGETIYVYPNGEAATLDELHTLAIVYDKYGNNAVLRYMDNLSDALYMVASEVLGPVVGFIGNVVSAFHELWRQMKEMSYTLREWIESAAEGRKENYRQWQQRNQRRKHPSIIKMYLRNKIQKPTDAARFNRARRRL